MAKGPKGFSEAEKDELRIKLQDVCEKSWRIFGYKKTSVGELTKKIGISTGAFYLLYASKEDLFYETLEAVQNKHIAEIRQIVSENKGKKGFKLAMRYQFDKYMESPFLFNFDLPDSLAFFNKLPKEKVTKLEFDSISFLDEVIEIVGLKLKIEKKMAYAVISSLLYMGMGIEQITYDHGTIFDFILDSTVDQIFA